MVLRRVIDEVGLLGEIFFLYLEEADWCRRIRAAGYRCVFTPVARIIHRDGGEKSANQMRVRMYVQKHRSKLLYVRKHYGVVGHLFAKTVLVVTSLGRWAAARRARAVPRRRRDAHTRVWRATRACITWRGGSRRSEGALAGVDGKLGECIFRSQ